jgi:DNA-binding transcriptional MerR regulator
MERSLTVGQLARVTGVPAKTIRYYEQVGVLPAPRRSATGYRQYARHDVHRLLFVRRARALGLSIPTLKTLTAELEQGLCLAMRPRLQELVAAQLCTVQQQIAEFQLLERQLTQVLQRLRTSPSSDHTDGCQCLEIDAPVAEETTQQPPPCTREGEHMNTPTALERFTLLTTTTHGHCGCGCGCEDFHLIQLVPPPPRIVPAEEEEHKQS